VRIFRREGSRGCGGSITKWGSFYFTTDALGNPLDFILTGGQASDIEQAEALLQLTPEGAQALAADKGYDSDKFVAALEAQGIEAIIPPRVNRISPRKCDWFAYKERHLIEFFFGKSKHYRRIFRDLKNSSVIIWGFCDSLPYSCWLRQPMSTELGFQPSQRFQATMCWSVLHPNLNAPVLFLALSSVVAGHRHGGTKSGDKTGRDAALL